MRVTLNALYHGDSAEALRFRLGLLGFDVLTLLFFVVSSMLEPSVWVYVVDYVIAAVLMADVLARAWIAPQRRRWFLSLDNWLDVVVIVSLLASMLVDNLSFLRVIRTLRLLRSYRVIHDLRKQVPWFREHQDVIESVTNLVVFVFFITACVFVVENGVNPKITHYLDALYFTVTTLTTTGFGDITPTHTPGRLLTIIIMVVGVSLFLRLVQTIFRPAKVKHRCPDCGLLRHDVDAVHCKHCGRVLAIDSEGD